MRITNTYMTRNYLGNLNNALELYNKSGDRINSGRKLSKMSDNVSDGTRALSIRTQSYKNEQIQENVKKAGETLTVAESNLMSIKDIIDNIHSKCVEALNGPKESAAEIFSIDFDSVKEQIIEFANCKYNDSYVLGGTNNQEPPFSVNQSGELYFNGTKVSEIAKKDGLFMGQDGFGLEVAQSRSVYIDVGINMTVKDGKVDPRTAFNMSENGLDALGYGTTTLKYTNAQGQEASFTAPNNAYELIGEMAECLREPRDYEKLAVLNDHLKETFDGLVNEIADIGIRTNYLDRHSTRLEDEEDVLTKIQNDLEYIKETDELINNKNMEYSWLLTLQFGSKVLPQSLMDYIK
jgi:flagellin-like hook-associated protein FlgL